jgi:predicted esterase
VPYSAVTFSQKCFMSGVLVWAFAGPVCAQKSNPISLDQLQVRVRSGDMTAAFVLGQRYLKGEAVEANVPMGQIFLLHAAKHDHAAAMLALGTMCRDGLSADGADATAAFAWFLKSAKAGNVDAMDLVIKAYENGIGVKASKVALKTWQDRAVEARSTTKPEDAGQPGDELESDLEKAKAGAPKTPFSLKAPTPPSRMDGAKELSAMGARDLYDRAIELHQAQEIGKALQYQHWSVAAGHDGIVYLASLCALSGDEDAAFYWLARAVTDRGLELTDVEGDRSFDPLTKGSRWSKFRAFILKSNTYWRSQKVHVVSVILPAGHAKGATIPVVLGFHAHGDNPKSFINEDYQEYADKFKVAFVGISGSIALGPGLFTWDTDPLKNIARVEEVIKSLPKTLTARQGAFVAIGFSEGASAAAEVAARLPKEFVGAIVMSPTGVAVPLRQLKELDGHLTQQFIVRVGAEEDDKNVQRAAAYAQAFGKLGSVVDHVVAQGVGGHDYPPDYWEKLGVWIQTIHKSRAVKKP